MVKTCVILYVLLCSTAGAKWSSVLIKDVPHVLQKPDFCGEACAEMYLAKLGMAMDQDAVFDQSGLNPLLARGCYTRELKVALERVGFKVGTVGYKVPAAKARPSLDKHFDAIHRGLSAGVPSIVCMHYDDTPNTTEHFRLVLGYDGDSDEIIYHEPAEANGAYQRMARTHFYQLWPLKYQRSQWTVIRFFLGGGRTIKNRVQPTGFTSADYAQHMMELKPKLPDDSFKVIISPPFVVIGNESEAVLKKRIEKTIRWSTTHLKKTYFDRDPDEILDIWLFKDAKTYSKYNQELFGGSPTTPFGYYSREYGALVMNINTGGGTLVHELVHPFMESNFEGYADWFNEGLASLYEQCGERDGKIMGFTNWRLAGLQKAIRAGTVPPFETLCGSSTDEFYHQDPGTNYSQARYLCYYLQEKGLLKKYYDTYRKHAATDPGGYKTLQAILGTTDMKAFKKDWERFVLKLKFR